MLKLNDRKWVEFKIGNLYNVTGSITTKPSDLIEGGNVPRITCSASNNGLDDFFENDATESGGVLTVDSATVGFIAYQEHDFIATDHVEKIEADDYIPRELGLFLVTAFTNSCASKYNYGYKFSQTRIKRQTVMLPVDCDDKPDIDFMRKYVEQEEEKKRKSYKDFSSCRLEELGEVSPIKSLTEKKWDSFFIDDIFRIEAGKRLESYNMSNGTRPFIGATDSGNGVTNFVSNQNSSLDRNVLGVNYNGNGMVISFYHPYECIFSDDVKRFHLKHYEDNQYVFLFMKTVILQQKMKYNYGYKFNANRMKRQLIVLPIDEKGNPDYEYMEQYTKNIMIQKYKHYLDAIK